MAADELARLRHLRANLERRALIYRAVRAFFEGQGFLEVETPLRVRCVAPEVNIASFDSEGWCLSTSPELHMKRLLASGYERLFQITRCFRKGERGRWHNPEFAMLEWYRAGGDYRRMVEDTECLTLAVANHLGMGRSIMYQGQRIDLSPPWPRVTVRDAFVHDAGWDPVALADALRFDTDLVTKVIPAFAPDRPTVLMDYPAPMASLARLKPGEPAVAERAEVFIGGLEIANAYSELTDPAEQARRFREEADQIERERRVRPALPGPFLEAVARLPECGGIALGLDRLVMLFCDAASLNEVVAFTADSA